MNARKTGDTAYVLTMIADTYGPNASSPMLPPVNRVLYCRSGDVALSDGTRLGPDEAWFGAREVSLEAGEEGADIWRWELAPEALAPAMRLGSGVDCHKLNAGPVETLRATDDWIMRCDAVRFPPGGCAFLHTHEGPGIRCLREGRIRIDTGGTSSRYEPGQAWFEAGPEPVFAQACEEQCTTFVRVMVLPAELKGKSSIRYVNEEDLEKPKSQRYKGYVDELIEH
jgi:hypothetical protein